MRKHLFAASLACALSANVCHASEPPKKLFCTNDAGQHIVLNKYENTDKLIWGFNRRFGFKFIVIPGDGNGAALVFFQNDNCRRLDSGVCEFVSVGVLADSMQAKEFYVTNLAINWQDKPSESLKGDAMCTRLQNMLNGVSR